MVGGGRCCCGDGRLGSLCICICMFAAFAFNDIHLGVYIHLCVRVRLCEYMYLRISSVYFISEHGG